jgi:hypothetical protein
MILLLLAACLPETYTITTDMYDIAGECWNHNVVVTLETKYWREWYLGDCPEEEGGGQPDLRPTADGLCMRYTGCTDEPPLATDDPNFSASREDLLVCMDESDDHTADCPAPALTEWP